MFYETPNTLVAKDLLTAAQMNVDIRDNIALVGESGPELFVGGFVVNPEVTRRLLDIGKGGSDLWLDNCEYCEQLFQAKSFIGGCPSCGAPHKARKKDYGRQN